MGFGHPPYEDAGCLSIIGVAVAIPVSLICGMSGSWACLLWFICFVAPFAVYQIGWDLERWRERRRNRPDDTDSSSRRDGGR